MSQAPYGSRRDFGFRPIPADHNSGLTGFGSFSNLLLKRFMMNLFQRRLGPDPHANGVQTVALRGCPDIWELASGDFAIFGIDITGKAIGHLPPTAGCGPDERIVLVPRNTLVLAKLDIPDHVHIGLDRMGNKHL